MTGRPEPLTPSSESCSNLPSPAGRWTAVLECEQAFDLLEELHEKVLDLPTPDTLTYDQKLKALKKCNRDVIRFFADLEGAAYPRADESQETES